MAEDTNHDPGAVEDSVGGASAFGLAVVTTWHRALSATARLVLRISESFRGGVRAWVEQWPRTVAYHRSADSSWVPDGARARETAAATGVRAFAFGVLIAGVIASSAKNSALPGVSLVLVELLWAAARYIIIALLMPRGAIDRPRLTLAYAAGLLPYAVGLNLPLRIAALAASAYLTRRGLLGAGVAFADTDRAVAWAFGGQAAVVLVGWLGRAMLALVVL